MSRFSKIFSKLLFFFGRLTIVRLRLLLGHILFLFWSEAAYAQSGGITAVNISARAVVSVGDGVLVGGFVVAPGQSKRVLIRALGPSLSAEGLAGAFQDPVLELHDSSGAAIAANDNWRDAQEMEIAATGIPPSDNRESALLLTLEPGSYTAIVRGKDSSTGIALVELYDLESLNGGRVTNISARGNATAIQSAIIGGFIISERGRVLVRAIGPELTAAGLTNALQDTLELHDANGSLIAFNDDWETDQEAETFFQMRRRPIRVSRRLCGLWIKGFTPQPCAEKTTQSESA